MDPVIGEVRMFAGNFAPLGWFFCQGQLLSIAQYDTLYSVIGNTYGGDGQQTFALPDLRGRVAIGAGSGGGFSPRALGEVGGYESNTLITAQMPTHAHTAQGTVTPKSSNTATTNNPVGNFPAVTTDSTNPYSTTTDTQMGPSTVNVTVDPAGGGQPMNNMAPFQVTNYIICWEGIYPDRS